MVQVKREPFSALTSSGHLTDLTLSWPCACSSTCLVISSSILSVSTLPQAAIPRTRAAAPGTTKSRRLECMGRQPTRRRGRTVTRGQPLRPSFTARVETRFGPAGCVVESRALAARPRRASAARAALVSATTTVPRLPFFTEKDAEPIACAFFLPGSRAESVSLPAQRFTAVVAQPSFSVTRPVRDSDAFVVFRLGAARAAEPTVTVRFAVAAGEPLHETVLPVNVRGTEQPSSSTTVTVTV